MSSRLKAGIRHSELGIRETQNPEPRIPNSELRTPGLRLDWCGRDAAAFACRHWHYSGTVPPGKNACIGVWEGRQFIGCIVFGCGVCRELGTAYGLRRNEVCELTRIALRAHRAPVSRMMSIALRMLRKQMPGIRLVVSFADPNQGHLGKIYQAANWIYLGQSAKEPYFLAPDGKLLHQRLVPASERTPWALRTRRHVWLRDQCVRVKMPGKYRYAYSFDTEMAERLRGMARPYPTTLEARGASIGSDATGFQPGEGGANPTAPLHLRS